MPDAVALRIRACLRIRASTSRKRWREFNTALGKTKFDMQILENIIPDRSNVDPAIGAIYILAAKPISGIWFPKDAAGFDVSFRWQIRGSRVDWQPFTPVNATRWREKIYELVEFANTRRKTSAFLRLSETSATRNNWSLPAIGTCPVRDETCQSCYALAGWYRVDLRRQLDRVLRLEYLRCLINEDKLSIWIDWMVDKLNALPPEEPFPRALRGYSLPSQNCYLRWHDSGDLFDPQYAAAIFKICDRTPRVAHFLPTRRGKMINAMVQNGARIPANLSIQISVNRGGMLEKVQAQSVREVLKAQPSAKIALSYFVPNAASRKVEARQIQEAFGPNATICPIVVAKIPKDRVCAGCRRCWAANIDAPVVYPQY